MEDVKDDNDIAHFEVQQVQCPISNTEAMIVWQMFKFSTRSCPYKSSLGISSVKTQGQSEMDKNWCIFFIKNKLDKTLKNVFKNVIWWYKILNLFQKITFLHTFLIANYLEFWIIWKYFFNPFPKVSAWLRK